MLQPASGVFVCVELSLYLHAGNDVFEKQLKGSELLQKVWSDFWSSHQPLIWASWHSLKS